MCGARSRGDWSIGEDALTHDCRRVVAARGFYSWEPWTRRRAGPEAREPPRQTLRLEEMTSAHVWSSEPRRLVHR